MKTFTILFLLLTSLTFSQQFYYNFTELNGFEDSTNTTHLFYRQMGTAPFYHWGDQTEHNLYHYNSGNGSDSVFLWSWWMNLGSGNHSLGVKFYNNNPGDYIYAHLSCNTDCDGYIIKSNGDTIFSWFSFAGNGNIGISQQDRNLIYGDFGAVARTTDGGTNWQMIYDKSLVSISPYNDNIQFFSSSYNLILSTDRGETFSTVDTGNFVLDFYWDPNQQTVYYYTREYGGSLKYSLFRSSNLGSAFTWQKVYESEKEFNVDIDQLNSGKIYISNHRNILKSSDYGTNFSEYYTAAEKIIDFYIKPGGEILYYCTKNKMYKWDGTELTLLKALPHDPKLSNYYPLAVGNMWINKTTIYYEPGYEIYESKVTITGKTVKPNGKEYFVKDDGYRLSYERFDEQEGRVFRYNANSGGEDPVLDLTMIAGDTLNSYYFGNDFVMGISYEGMGEVNYFGANRKYKRFREISGIVIIHEFDLAEGLGIINTVNSHCFGGGNTILKGAVINGIVYGDTTLVSVDENYSSPAEFSLYQNYPNPFNPSTIISFNLAEAGKVNLSVFDVLGRKVATLVDGEMNSGEHRVEFDGSNYAAGIYFYKLQSGKYSAINKMTLLK